MSNNIATLPLTGELLPALTDIAREVTKLSTRVVSDSHRIGELLLQAREQFPGNIEFGAWRKDNLEEQASITAKTAERLMNLVRTYPTLADLPQGLGLTALYALSAPNVTDRVRAEVMRRVENGEATTTREMNNVLASVQAAARETERASSTAPDADAVAEMRERRKKAKAEAAEVSETYAAERARVTALARKSPAKRREVLAAWLHVMKQQGLIEMPAEVTIVATCTGKVSITI